jgi:UDP-N-acetylmuramate--alanine ligase
MQRTDITTRLESLGVRFAQRHDPANVSGAEVVVYSSAVRPGNPEMVAARDRGLAVIPRAQLLADLMRLRQGIAIAGAHGKTTTTSMIALVLDVAGLDPTAVIGGRVSSFGSNAKLGRGQYLVAEADESDRSFLKLTPRFAVITNIDREHLEAYRDFDDLKTAFVQFANSVPAKGAVILCCDDPHLAGVRADIKRHVVTYGLTEAADVTANDVQLKGFGSNCTVRARRPGGRPVELGQLHLAVPGRHNILNALAAVAMARELGVAWSDIARALAGFHGAERRFQRRGEVNGIAVVEDYGHHPTEIAAVVAAAKPIASGRLIVAFQPHRFTRTQFLMNDFGRAFTGADALVITDIYAAGEDPIAGVTLDSLATAVRADFTGELRVVPALSDVAGELAALAKPGDMVLLLGAGSIGGIASDVVRALGGTS